MRLGLDFRIGDSALSALGADCWGSGMRLLATCSPLWLRSNRGRRLLSGRAGTCARGEGVLACGEPRPPRDEPGCLPESAGDDDFPLPFADGDALREAGRLDGEAELAESPLLRRPKPLGRTGRRSSSGPGASSVKSIVEGGDLECDTGVLALDRRRLLIVLAVGED